MRPNKAESISVKIILVRAQCRERVGDGCAPIRLAIILLIPICVLCGQGSMIVDRFSYLHGHVGSDRLLLFFVLREDPTAVPYWWYNRCSSDPDPHHFIAEYQSKYSWLKRAF